ncbi:MAG: hypothetical protein WCZ86_03825 [Desulfurivibrionaceae bacterium]
MVAILLLVTNASAAGKQTEKYYQDKWCAEHGGVTEYVLPGGGRVDCLTDTLAVEFDWAKKWAEGYGQAKYYAAMTGRRGAVVLIVGPRDGRFVDRLKVVAAGGVEVLTMAREM